MSQINSVGNIKENKITAKQALKEIQWLKHSFIGDRQELHGKIDEIIKKVK